jgi:hypothetical protein
MRNSPSGAVNGRYVHTFPAGTAVGPGGSSGSTIPIACRPGDSMVANWDENSFGPAGILYLDAQATNTDGLALVRMWNWSADPIITPVDLNVIVQVIPQQ